MNLVGCIQYICRLFKKNHIVSCTTQSVVVFVSNTLKWPPRHIQVLTIKFDIDESFSQCGKNTGVCQ